MSERKRKLVDEIKFHRDLIASRHATLDVVLSDVLRLEILLLKAEIAFEEDEGDEDLSLLKDEIVRVTINRIALLLTDAQKSFVRGRPDLRFKTSLETAKEIHAILKDFYMSEETEDWFKKNDDALAALFKSIRHLDKKPGRQIRGRDRQAAS